MFTICGVNDTLKNSDLIRVIYVIDYTVCSLKMIEFMFYLPSVPNRLETILPLAKGSK